MVPAVTVTICQVNSAAIIAVTSSTYLGNISESIKCFRESQFTHTLQCEMWFLLYFVKLTETRVGLKDFDVLSWLYYTIKNAMMSKKVSSNQY